MGRPLLRKEVHQQHLRVKNWSLGPVVDCSRPKHYRGMTHRAQISAPPAGRTIVVNERGEPRMRRTAALFRRARLAPHSLGTILAGHDFVDGPATSAPP
jgi:hypothetical protein